MKNKFSRLKNPLVSQKELTPALQGVYFSFLFDLPLYGKLEVSMVKWRNVGLFFLGIVFCVILIPLLIVTVSGGLNRGVTPKMEQHSAKAEEPLDKIKVYNKQRDQVEEMDFHEYIKGVVAGEMPASFNMEALKAQAVVVRSFTLARKAAYEKTGFPPEHNGAEICTDPAHCQAYLSKEDAVAKWGESWLDESWAKVSQAVDATTGVIMLYNDAPVNAIFHSTSSGHTENSKDVWGGDVPYLVGVDSPGDKESPKYESQKQMTVEEFKKAVLDQYPDTRFENPELVTNIVRSNAGGIISADIGSTTLKGTQIRTLFALQSTNINFRVEGDTVNMNVLGNGHGVGMSQYGANYLAGQGMGYQDILKTYYTGVTIVEP